MRLGTWSQLYIPRHTVHGGGREPSCWPVLIVLGLAGLTMAATTTLSAWAAETGTPRVVVNQDILNNLDWAAAVSARVSAQARVQAAGGSDLPQQPGSLPVSRLLIQPQRAAPPTPPTRKATQMAEASESPAPADEIVVPATTPEPAGAGEEDNEPGAAPVAEAPPTPDNATAANDAPPAIPAPPEPIEPAAIAEDPIAAPSPPEPQPTLPEPVLLAEAPSLPVPEPPAEPPASETEATVEPEPGAIQTAVRMPRALVVGEYRLLFPEGSVDLTETAKEKLGLLAQQLQQQSEAERRIQLQAFASSSATNASVARRLSLARALAVRTFLIEKGIRSRRIDVRALGAKAGEGPPDRVDVLDAHS